MGEKPKAKTKHRTKSAVLQYYSNLKPPVIYSNVSLILSINLSKIYPGNNIGPKIIIYGTIKRPIIFPLLFLKLYHIRPESSICYFKKLNSVKNH